MFINLLVLTYVYLSAPSTVLTGKYTYLLMTMTCPLVQSRDLLFAPTLDRGWEVKIRVVQGKPRFYTFPPALPKIELKWPTNPMRLWGIISVWGQSRHPDLMVTPWRDLATDKTKTGGCVGACGRGCWRSEQSDMVAPVESLRGYSHTTHTTIWLHNVKNRNRCISFIILYRIVSSIDFPTLTVL